MVCIYCGGHTDVVNSRRKHATNTVWRRRRCAQCGAIFTSREQPDLSTSLAFEAAESHIMPFDRDQLFLSLYDACRHRPTAASDATALTESVVAHVWHSESARSGLINRRALRDLAYATLAHFDAAAASHYAAFHPEKQVPTA